MKRKTSDGENSLSHTRWNCTYHIIFASKYSVSSKMGYLKVKVH